MTNGIKVNDISRSRDVARIPSVSCMPSVSYAVSRVYINYMPHVTNEAKSSIRQLSSFSRLSESPTLLTGTMWISFAHLNDSHRAKGLLWSTWTNCGSPLLLTHLNDSRQRSFMIQLDQLRISFAPHSPEWQPPKVFCDPTRPTVDLLCFLRRLIRVWLRLWWFAPPEAPSKFQAEGKTDPFCLVFCFSASEFWSYVIFPDSLPSFDLFQFRPSNSSTFTSSVHHN